MSENKKLISRTYIYGERTENISIAVPGTKKEEILAKFYKILEEYHNPKVLALEPKPKPGKESYNRYFAIREMQDEAPDLPKEVLSELFEASKPKITNSIEVSALPKDKKRISPGLYSGGGKFYTNKIVENQLQILEWENRESAEEYLTNLK